MDSAVQMYEQNDGTTKTSLPCDEYTWATEEFVGNPDPAVHKGEALRTEILAGNVPKHG